MDIIVVVKLSVALLKMLNPVETRILDLWRNALSHSTTVNISHKHTRVTQVADILLE